MADTYNIGPTVPALMKAHEERYAQAQKRIEELKLEIDKLNVLVHGYKIRAESAESNLERAQEWKRHFFDTASVTTQAALALAEKSRILAEPITENDFSSCPVCFHPDCNGECMEF